MDNNNVHNRPPGCVDLTVDNCPRCGATNPLNAVFCSACGFRFADETKNTGPSPSYNTNPSPYPSQGLGYRGPQVQVPPSPGYTYSSLSSQVDNYMAPAILSTLFCCLPCGIVAIVYSSQVNGKLQIGDYAGALSAAENAKTWSWISFWLGIALIFLFIVGGL